MTSNWNSSLATWNKATSTANWRRRGETSRPPRSTGRRHPAERQLHRPRELLRLARVVGHRRGPGWIRSATSNRGLLIKQADEARPPRRRTSGSSNGTAANIPTVWVNYRPAPIGAYPADEFVGEALNDRMGIQVNVATGNLMVQATDLEIAGTGLDLAISRTYNSGSEGSKPELGQGWMLDAARRVGL